MRIWPKKLELPVDVREIIKPGMNADSYWKSGDMVKQLTDKALPYFEALHFECTGVFISDQSTNHNVYSKEALIANRITLKKKFEKDWHIEDGRFIVNGKHQAQSLFCVSQLKGIRQARYLLY